MYYNSYYLIEKGLVLVKFLKELGSWILYIAIAFVIASLLNIFVFQITDVSGDSMKPTLSNNDMYVISKLGNLTNACPDYGDIIVVDSRAKVRTLKDDFTEILKYNVITQFALNRQQPHIYWVKRVIGLPGDTIELRDGKVYRNGEVLDEPYLDPDDTPDYRNNGIRISHDNTITIPEGHIWVMGDNRNNSSDSRSIGPVPVENVIGKLKFKIKSGK